MSLGFSTIGGSVIGASSYQSFAPTFSVKVVDRQGQPIPQGTIIQAAWFDQNQPQLFLNPVWAGLITVASEGTVSKTVDESSLANGDTGWLVLSDSNGDPNGAYRAFSGPVSVT